MRDILMLLLAGVLVDNLVCVHCVGIVGGALGADTLRRSALLGGYVTAASLLSVAVCYPVYNYLLLPIGGGYFSTLLFVLCCASAVFGSAAIFPKLRTAFTETQLTVVFGTALGICCLSVLQKNMLYSLVAALCYGAGLLFLMCLFFCARLSLKPSRVPKAFSGFAIDLVITAIIALVIYGIK